MHQVFDAAEAADEVSPINESGRLVLAGLRAGALREDGPAAAVVDLRDGTIMLAVHPEHRRLGHGTRLLRTLLDDYPGLRVWAFGSLPGSAELAAAVGLSPVRDLLRMERPLDDTLPPVPDTVAIGSFREEDADQIVAINAAAFAHHPEQGRLTRAEFDDLRRQPWFSPEGLLVARAEGEVAGFHWTKRHGPATGEEPIGEVYVLAVDPRHEGRGLGRALLAAGLRHLRDVGETRVELFVEASPERTVELYRRAGFVVTTHDTCYGRP